MAKARILAVVIIGVLLLTALVPGFGMASVESPPAQPVNLSPDNATTEIGPLHSFFTAVYSGTDELLNAQWQIYRSDSEPSLMSDGSYDKPLVDSGLVTASDPPTYAFPVGALEYSQKYWWHVRVQDVTGAWSPWSVQTWFQVIANSPPNQPNNIEPLDAATGVTVTPVLGGSDFSDPNASAYVGLADTHSASQWQIRGEGGTYGSPVYDSGKVTTGTLTSISVPAGKLAASTPYYWHVRYRDNYDDLDGNEEEHWSAYSEETLFTTKSLSLPVAGFLADKTEVIAGEQAVTFTDNSTPAGEITAWFWDFGDQTTDNWTLRDRPATGKINHIYSESGTYTVSLTVTNAAGSDPEVKDSYIVVHATPKASFLATPAAPKAGADVTFTDGSTGDITKWTWEFGDGSSQEWTKETRPADKKIIHAYKKAGTYVATLTVSGTFEGKDVQHAKNSQVEVSGPSGFHFSLWMVGVAVAVIVVLACVLYLVRARKAK